MSLPYPKPLTRQQAQANAIHYAEDASTGGMAFPQTKYLANVAQAWAMIADTFPEDETEVVAAVNEEESFEGWATRQIDKTAAILSETMGRVDRLEARANGQVRVAVSGQDEAYDWMHTFLSPEEWRVVKELRNGRLVTHTPDYVAQLRKDAPYGDERRDLNALRSGELVLVSPDYIEEHQSLIDQVKDVSARMAGVKVDALYDAETRIRAYMGNTFSAATIAGVVEAIQGNVTEFRPAKPVERPVGVLADPGEGIGVQALNWETYRVLRAIVARAITEAKGKSLIIDKGDIAKFEDVDLIIRALTLDERMWQVRLGKRPV